MTKLFRPRLKYALTAADETASEHGGGLMQYRDWAKTMQVADAQDIRAHHLADANVNPATGLATDYLNHFNEAIMLLEMLPGCADCLTDFLNWRAKSYREHFAATGTRAGDIAMAAYDRADMAASARLDSLAGAMIALLEATRAALSPGMPADAANVLAGRAAASLRPLVARAGAVINGMPDGIRPAPPQTVVDAIMQHR